MIGFAFELLFICADLYSYISDIKINKAGIKVFASSNSTSFNPQAFFKCAIAIWSEMDYNKISELFF